MTLIERLEREGPSRELADEVLLACGWTRGPCQNDILWWIGPDGMNYGTDGPNPLTSLDAALTLVPEGYDWTIEPDSAWIRWMGKVDVDQAQGVLNGRGGKCTAIALTIAALRARGINGL